MAQPTPSSAADDGLYHPGRYSPETTSTLKPASLAANAMITGMPQSLVWHTNGLTRDQLPVSNENQVMTAKLLESSPTVLLSGTLSVTSFDSPTTSATSVTESLPQVKESTSNDSHVYQLLIVILVALLIILLVLSWFKREADRRKAILATYHQPTNPKDRFASAFSQFKGLSTGFLAISAEALSAISASFTCSDLSSGKCLKERTAACETKRTLMERISEKNVRILMRTAMTFSNFRRRIADRLERRRVDCSAHDENEDITGGSVCLEDGPRSPSIYETDKQAFFNTSNAVASTIIPPPPAIVPPRTNLNNDCSLNGNAPQKPTLVISPDTACLEERCTASESSYTSRGSEATSLQTIDESNGHSQLPSVRQLRLHVHRIEMEFTPRRETQIGVKEGDEVILIRLFDDGWAFCEVEGTNKQGLVPRACLSALPYRRKKTPPNLTSVQLVPPATYSHTYSRPGTPVSPISPTSSVFPRFYSSGSSARSVS